MRAIINRLQSDKRLRRFIKFGIVGVSGLGVNMLGLWLAYDVLGLTLYLASPLSIVVAIFSNFVLNDMWTWRENRDSRHYAYRHRVARYYLSASLGALINYVILLLLTKTFGMNYLLSNLIGIFAGMFSNFILSEWWVFKSIPKNKHG